MNGKTKKIIQWTAGVIFSLLIIFVILISSFEIVLYSDMGVYRKEYEKYEVLDELDMTMDDAMYVTREMMDYLRGDKETLSVITEVEGKRQDFFNEQDRFHMREVRDIFAGGLRLRTAALVAAAVSLLILYPCDGHGALYRRQRTAAVRRYDAVERRRTGAAVQRGCQTFAGKDVGRQFRLFRDGQRPDGARVPLSARQRGRRRYAERLRGRHCLGRGRVARETRFGAQGDDRSRRSLSRRQIRPRTADRRNQRALRVQEQGTGRVRRFAVEALRRRFVATSGAGLRNRAGRKQRAAQRLAGAPERSEQPDRSERAAQYDALSFGSGVGPDHRPDQKFPPDGPGVSGTVGVRAFVSERRRRDFQQTLLRIAVRHGRDGIPVLLRAVGVYSAGKHRFLGADDHYVADRVRPVGRRQTERTQGRRRDRAQRYERFGSSCGHLGRAEKLLRDGSAAIRFVPGVGP